MSNFVYDRVVVEYHTKIAERDVSTMTEVSQYLPEYIEALANAKNRLNFWSNVKISDEA